MSPEPATRSFTVFETSIARSCQGRHAGANVDGDPPDGVALELDLTGVQPDAHFEAEILYRSSFLALWRAVP